MSRRRNRHRGPGFAPQIYGINLDGTQEPVRNGMPKFDGVSGSVVAPENMGFQRGYPVDMRRSAGTYEPMLPLAWTWPDLITYNQIYGKARKPAGDYDG